MRTTVEITDEQRVRFTALAAQRGLRGFSALLREAIDMYLEEQDDLDEVLALEGCLSDEEAHEMERRIAEAREAPWHGTW